MLFATFLFPIKPKSHLQIIPIEAGIIRPSETFEPIVAIQPIDVVTKDYIEPITPPAPPETPSRSYSVDPNNPYVPGQCTAYAWGRRPDLPRNLGNAYSWAANAAAAGFRVDSIPAVGAIGMTRAYGHVVYIEAVNDNGTVSLSEQNYKGPFIISTRIAPISEFIYIH